MLRRQCAERSGAPALCMRYSKVYVVFHLMAAWLVHVALSPPVLAVLAGMTAVVLYGKWQMLMRTASWHVRVRGLLRCAVRCTAHVIMPCDARSVHGRRTLLSPP